MSSSENTVLTVALIAVLVSAVSLGFVYFSASNYKSGLLTGYAVNDNATINITISSNIAINFSTRFISLGSGYVSPGADMATIITGENYIQNGTNWAISARHFVLDNIGTSNVSINISSATNASQFIGGSNPNPAFRMNVSQNKAGSCLNSTNFNLSISYYDITSSPRSVCDVLKPDTSANSINISIHLIIPRNSLNGSLTNTITATAIG